MSKFTPSPQEVFLVNQIFAQADTQKLGVVTGDAAVKIFNGTNLSPSILAEVWNLADEDNNGVLTRKGVAVAVRLLGHAQRGEKVTEALIHKPAPVPTIDGLTPPLFPQTTGVPLPKSPPPGLPPLTAQDRAKFMKLFIGCGPNNGLLSGEKARDVFVKSKLPVDKLSQIWNLADTKGRGVLDATDFTIAMYLIQASMSGQVQFLPTTLPPGLYGQAAGESGFKTVAVHATGESGSFSPASNSSFSGRPTSTIQPQFTGSTTILQPQMTGQARQSPAPQLPTRSALANVAPAFPFLQQQSTGHAQQWDVTSAEKASADIFFHGLDTQKKGYIEGEIAVPFMLQSELSEDVLAHIWDLADLNNDGRLTRDGFAVALHLIQGKLAGKEVPASIPMTLIPPSMRTQPPASVMPSQPSVQDSIRDLIWDDSPPTSATFSQQPPPVLQPQSTGTVPLRQATLASPPQRSQSMDPFASSPFGVSGPSVHKDLLGDDDEPAATSPPLQDQSAEIGNVKNQLGSTNRSLETATTERQNIERVLAEQAAQLSALQTQLSSAKAAYETETRLLGTLRERYASQTAEIQKSREELIHAESDLSALRVEKAEIEGAVLRDKEEVRDLQRKMTEVGMQMETLKVGIEKAKKEAKQQKGLLAIAKKQLATREAERTKVEKEREEAQREAQTATTEREEAEVELAKEVPAPLTKGPDVTGAASPDILALAVAQPLPATPEISSPTASVMSGKSNNPFERVALASGPQSRSQSPFLPFTSSSVLPTSPAILAEPLADSSVPTPSNPFRFSDVFNTDETQEVPAAPTGAGEIAFVAPAKEGPSTTPSPLAIGDLDVLSPTGTEMFSTPLGTASVPTNDASPAEIVESSTARFPSLDTVAADAAAPAPQTELPPSEALSENVERQTDLDHQLRELEVDESESDSDSSDEDNEPLSNVKDRLSVDLIQKPANGSAHPPATPFQPPELSAFDDSFSVMTAVGSVPAISSPGSSTPMQIQSSTAPGPSSVTHDLFDSAFALPPPPKQPPIVESPPAEVPAPQANGTAEEPAADVNDFDEAMGKLSNSSNATSQFSQFSFDSAFDDNFDFAAATAAVKPPSPANGSAQHASAVAPPQNDGFDNIFLRQPSGNAAPVAAPVDPPTFGRPAAEPKSISFDDAFGAGTSDNHAASGQSGPGNGSHAMSFDDAFGGNTSDALALDSTFGGPVQQSPAGLSAQSNKSSAPFPTTSPPLSPNARAASPEYAARRSISPPLRQTSPPPRHSSPKPRPSTASSDKVPPTVRHSKLSIRLPFGRKKKTHDAPPLPSTLSQQVVEDPTPAVEDDVEAVKQLCGMGFSRTQAVTALELHGYDVQRALNSLLGQ
ncbi:hypothetical protein B0H21DRAFT_880758 [Amylocystis lapponica]|nr:hypothetical protein B0H21DRAFT_880758 [Amylocystis lapponica]